MASILIVYIHLQVGEVAEQIKIAFKQRVEEKDWLDETTKEQSKEKVATGYGCKADVIKAISLCHYS